MTPRREHPTTGEPPEAYIQDRVAEAFREQDMARDEYLTRRVRQEFAAERLVDRAAWIEKARVTREANKAKRLARGEKR